MLQGRQTIVRILTLAIAALALAACQDKGARQPCPVGLVCYEAGNGFDPTSLDPHQITSTWESRIAVDLFLGLTQNDAQGHAIPGAATSWETSADGKVWTFHLRPSKWSDGAPLTAEDFVYSLRRILDPATAAPYASLIYVIKNAQAVNEGKAPGTALGVRAIDPLTLEISLEHPAPYLIQLAAHPTMLPVPRHVIERYGDKWAEPGRHVSNGAFKLVSWRIQDRLVVEKNPLFYDVANICLDRVSYYPTTDYISGERQVGRGELDSNIPISASRVAYLKKPGNLPDYVRSRTSLGVYYMVINGETPKLRDVRVRQALSMAIDRDFIVNGPMRGSGLTAAYTFIPPGVANYASPPPPAWASWRLERRQAEARRLLAAAGFGPKNPLTVEVTSGLIDGSSDLDSLQSDWAQIGVKTGQVNLEGQIAYQALRQRDFEIGRANWTADFNDPSNFLFIMQSDTGAINYGDYNNPVFDDLLARADAEPDQAKRTALLQQAETIMLADGSVIPLYFAAGSALVSPRVTGWIDNVMDIHPTRWLCFKDVRR